MRESSFNICTLISLILGLLCIREGPVLVEDLVGFVPLPETQAKKDKRNVGEYEIKGKPSIFKILILSWHCSQCNYKASSSEFDKLGGKSRVRCEGTHCIRGDGEVYRP